MTVTEKADLAEVFDEFFTVLHKGCDSEVLDVFVEMDLSLTQARVVFLLAEHGTELPVGEAADHLGVSVATAGRAVDRLVSLGMVDRREDPDDRRSKLVSLTAEGRRLADTQRAGMREKVRTFSDALPADVACALHEAMTAALECIPDHQRAGASCAHNEVRTSS